MIPGLLLRLLEYADSKSGIRQSELREKLDIRQSHLSKLTAKLRAEGWVEDLSQADDDKRVRADPDYSEVQGSGLGLRGKVISCVSAPYSKKGDKCGTPPPAVG